MLCVHNIFAGTAGNGLSHFRHDDIVDGRGPKTLQSRDPWRQSTANHNVHRWVYQKLA